MEVYLYVAIPAGCLEIVLVWGRASAAWINFSGMSRIELPSPLYYHGSTRIPAARINRTKEVSVHL